MFVRVARRAVAIVFLLPRGRARRCTCAARRSDHHLTVAAAIVAAGTLVLFPRRGYVR
jgi:hypothetical protein